MSDLVGNPEDLFSHDEAHIQVKVQHSYEPLCMKTNNVVFVAQLSLRSSQTDQSLHYPYDESLDPLLSRERIVMAQIRLDRCPC